MNPVRAQSTRMLLLKFRDLVLISTLAILTQCSLIRDPLLNKEVATFQASTVVGYKVTIHILSNGDSFKTYWFDRINSTYTEGTPIRGRATGPGDEGIFNVIADLKTNKPVVLSRPSDPSSIKINYGFSVFAVPIDCTLETNAPSALFIDNVTLVVVWAQDCAPLKRTVTQQTGTRARAVSFVNLGAGSYTTTRIQQFSSYPSTPSSISINAFNRSEWIAVWMGYDAGVVQGVRGADSQGSLSQVFNVTDFYCDAPVLQESTLTCVAQNGSIVVAQLGPTGVATKVIYLAKGYYPQVHVMSGTRSTMTMLVYALTSGPCIRLQSVQYPLFSTPLCWQEELSQVSDQYPSVLAPVVTSLTNHSIVVAYPTYNSTSGLVTLKTQQFNLKCGDGVIGPDEECDSSPNCNDNCVCDQNYFATAGGCVFNPSTPVTTNPDVVPILDCFVTLNETHVRGYFSYENLQQQTAVVPIGSKNFFSVIGQNAGQPTVFSPGKITFFPASSFAVTWSKQTIDWTLTNYQLTINDEDKAYLCPKNVSVEVDVIVSRVPNATELQQIAAKIAEQLGIDPSRVVVAVVIDGEDIKLVITIIDGGSRALESAVAAEKLIEQIRTASDELEDGIKEIVPIALDGGSVRGQPGATQGQKGVTFQPPVSSLPSTAVSYSQGIIWLNIAWIISLLLQ